MGLKKALSLSVVATIIKVKAILIAHKNVVWTLLFEKCSGRVRIASGIYSPLPLAARATRQGIFYGRAQITLLSGAPEIGFTRAI